MNPSQAVEDFLDYLEANDYSPHTVRSYGRDLRDLLVFCRERHQRSIKAVTANHISAFLNSGHAQNGFWGQRRSPVALNRLRATLRSFFGWLRDTGQIHANPAARVRIRSLPQRPPRVLKESEEKRLLNMLRKHDCPRAFRDRVMVEMLRTTGMRVSELVGLRMDDVDLEAASVTIQTKGGAMQARHLRPDITKLLRRYMKWRGTLPEASEALFVGTNGTGIGVRHFQRRLTQWLDQAGVNGQASAHTFRHTLATRLLALTDNLRLVQRALGHRSIASTIRYAQVPDAKLAAALEAV